MIDITPVQKIASIDKVIKEKEEEIKRLRAERQELIEDAFDVFGEQGVNNIQFGGDINRTVYIKEGWRVKLKPGMDKHNVATMLKAHGFTDLIKEDFNLNSLTSRFKEEFLEKEDNTYNQVKMIPSSLERAIEFKPFYTIESRKK